MRLLTIPFRERKNRLVRNHDHAFTELMNAEKSVVRLLGPRRIGKTDLVSNYAQGTSSPTIIITLKPLPADILNPSLILAELLAREIAALTHVKLKAAAKLKFKYDALLQKETPRQSKLSFSGELAATPAKLSATYESASSAASKPGVDADVEITYQLRRLEMAAEQLGIRPIIFFDEVQELIVGRTYDAGMAAIWSIRNEAQHHTSCRYVFAGSNQRLFAKLQAGRRAPFLNFGTALEIPPLTVEEIDAWAVPMFRRGQRHVSTLRAVTGLLCGKIGEVADLCAWLWSNSKPGDVLDDALLRQAISGAARASAELPETIRMLSPVQTKVLRWVLENPGKPPYGLDGLRPTINAGTIRNVLEKLVELELVESFSELRYSCTTPLRILAALYPAAWAPPEPAGR